MNFIYALPLYTYVIVVHPALYVVKRAIARLVLVQLAELMCFSQQMHPWKQTELMQLQYRYLSELPPIWARSPLKITGMDQLKLES